ncbi:MAG: hypothetical protein KC636_01425, partial [Myxococcales bacterium]|nr:hypothetical protein [Myxococcales bacterium]
MALFVRIEQLAARRQTLGPLVDRYTQGDPAFADAAIEWLRETEEVMGRLRLPTGARLSTLRAAIVRAGDEVGPRPEGGRSRADAR